jgi:hypothetical protein
VKKISLILTFLLSLTFVTSVIAQKSIVVEMPSDVSVFAGEIATINLTIINNQTIGDIFSISIFPSYWEKISVSPEKANVEIGPKSNSTVKILFNVLPEAKEGIQVFSITVTSITNTSIADTKTILVSILRKSPVYISNFTLNKQVFNPEETLIIKIELTNTINMPSESYSLETTIEKNGETVEKFKSTIPSIPAKSSEIISNSFTFEKYAPPGNYLIKTILKDSLNKIVDRKSAEVTLSAIYKLPEQYTQKTRSIGILSASITVKVKNEGNIPTPEFYIKESIPAFAENLFKPETKPTSVNKINNIIEYSWLIPSLGPGEEIEIRYQFILWHVWISLLALAFVVIIIFKVTLTPKIIKKYRYTYEKDIAISLEVRNRGFSEIRDVLVRDFVPTVTQLVEKFETLKPKARKTARGMELTWKFDLIKPREERVLTYRIRPTVGIIGTLKLPAAKMEYVEKGVKKTKSSEILIVKPK